MYKDLQHNGEYNSKGDPIFKGNITVENTFDIETIEKRIANIKQDIIDIRKGADKCIAEIEASKTNVEMHKVVLEDIKAGVEITQDMAFSAEIYFRNLFKVLGSNPEKDELATQELISEYEKEITDFTEVIKQLKELNIHAKSTESGTVTGEEKVGATE
jgi:hypothetical protein